MTRVEVEVDVIAQARHAAAVAPLLCAPTGCAWYHGVWPALRALGVVASPQRHERFFARALRTAPTSGHRLRVLVTGAADGGMAEVVLAAVPDAQVTMVDRCATAVEVAVDTARRRGSDADGLVADLLDPPGDTGVFDVVVTHGLFGITPAPERGTLARTWSDLLVTGGRLVTTTSLSGPDATDPVTFTADAADGFAARVAALAARRAAPSRETDLGWSTSDLEAAAGRWARQAVVHPVRSVDDIARTLTAAGFEADIARRDVPGSIGVAASGPWTARRARYAEIVATKR